jgi:hypothetical protein
MACRRFQQEGRRDIQFAGAARVIDAPHNPAARSSEIPVELVFKGFPAVRPHRSRRHDAAKALFCRSGEGWYDAAHICSKLD